MVSKYPSYEKFDILIVQWVFNNIQNIQIYCTKILSKLKCKKKEKKMKKKWIYVVVVTCTLMYISRKVVKLFILKKSGKLKLFYMIW